MVAMSVFTKTKAVNKVCLIPVVYSAKSQSAKKSIPRGGDPGTGGKYFGKWAAAASHPA